MGSEWGQSFSYDGFSNLWGKSVTKGSATTLSLTIGASTNRITSAGHAYDAAGNLTQMPFGAGTQTQTFDHENRVMSLTNANGTQTNEYNHAGQRVKRTAGGATDYCFYGVRGELLARNRQTVIGSVTYFVYQEMFFYFGGRLAARLGPGVNTGTYQTVLPLLRDRVDRLGSVGDGSKYFPYGKQRTQTANDAFKFATYYRDGVTGLDYAQQRYYSSVQGRFLSADPSARSIRPWSPKTWNRYSYVNGDPVNANDPSGLCDVFIAGITIEPSASSTHTNGFTANSISAYPYSGGPDAFVFDMVGGTLEVMSQAAGATTATRTALAAILRVSQDPGPINVFAFSGGAEAFAAALQYLPSDIAGRIQNVTYMSPGGINLPGSFSGQTAFVVSNSQIDTFILRGPRPEGSVVLHTSCDHDANCQFERLHQQLSQLSGAPCRAPATIQPSRYLYFEPHHDPVQDCIIPDTHFFFSWRWLWFRERLLLELVSSTVTFN